MKNTLKLLTLSFLLMFAGCVPSLNPLYTEQDLMEKNSPSACSGVSLSALKGRKFFVLILFKLLDFRSLIYFFPRNLALAAGANRRHRT